jgi:ribosomal-protein-alanine N-acetyltransferase
LLIRPAIAGDIPSMLELEHQCATAAHWSADQYRVALGIDSPETRGLALAAFSNAEQNAPASSTESSFLAAFLVARIVGTEWEVENVVVSPEVRRQGVGLRLLQESISRARESGAEAMFLEVRESNQAARALYTKAGFAKAGRRKGYYSGPSEDAIVFRLTI